MIGELALVAFSGATCPFVLAHPSHGTYVEPVFGPTPVPTIDPPADNELLVDEESPMDGEPPCRQ